MEWSRRRLLGHGGEIFEGADQRLRRPRIEPEPPAKAEARREEERPGISTQSLNCLQAVQISERAVIKCNTSQFIWCILCGVWSEYIYFRFIKIKYYEDV